MKFSNMTGVPSAKLSNTLMWSSDNGSCCIISSCRTSPLTWVRMDVYNYYFEGISCDPDGVAGFVVKELIDIVNTYGGGKIGLDALTDKIESFFQALIPRATLLTFKAYKDEQRRQA